MAVTIRLSRIGKRHSPIYRMVVQDKQVHPYKKVIEQLGNYYAMNQHDPKKKQFECNVDRLDYWISKGATCSPRVKSLLKKNGISVTPATPSVTQAK